MTIEIFFQGVPELLKVRTDILPEDKNGNFARGSPTELSLSLGPTKLSVSPNTPIKNNSICLLPLVEGGLISPCPFFFNDF